MRAWVLVALAGLAAGACRRRGGAARREKDPRVEFATGCVDSRYVTAPAMTVPAEGGGEVRALATAVVGAQRFVGWATDEGASVWREGAATSVRVTPALVPGAFALAGTGQRVLVAWAEAGAGRLQVASLDAEGRAEAWPPVTTGAREIALAGRRDGALVVWREGDGGGASVRARALDARGRAVGAAVNVAAGAVDAPAVTWTGARYAVAWRERAGDAGLVRARALSADGAAQGEAFVAVRTDAEVGPPAIAWGGGRLAVAWSDRRNGDLGLQVTTVDFAGRARAEPQKLSVRFAPGARASLAWDGGAFGAAWWEPVGGGAPRAFFALVDRTGRRIGTGMTVETDADAALTLTALAWERPAYVLATVRAGAGVELRRTGPQGCDMPPMARAARP